jgi:hypothetical protein
MEDLALDSRAFQHRSLGRFELVEPSLEQSVDRGRHDGRRAL